MIINNEIGQLPRRHGWIRTIVEGFADPDLTARPRDCVYYPTNVVGNNIAYYINRLNNSKLSRLYKSLVKEFIGWINK